MNQKMINILSAIPAHAAPISYWETSSPQILSYENLPPCSHPTKKETRRGAFTPKCFSKGKWRKRFLQCQRTIKRVDVKISITLELSPHPIHILIWRKAPTNSTFQSLKSRWNCTSQLQLSPTLCHTTNFFTDASRFVAIKVGKPL